MSTATETVSQLDVNCERNSENSQNVQKLAVIKQLQGFCKKIWIKFELKLAVFSKSSKNLSFFIKIDRFSEKLWSFLKKAKVSNLAVESDWKSKVSQNVQKLFCF